MKDTRNEQDIEDYEQEKRIREWINANRSEEFEYKYISSKGTPRNSLIVGSFSLDEEIGENGGGTFADIIAGSDGRDLECREKFDDIRRDLDKEMSQTLFALGFKIKEIKWLKKIFQKSIANRRMLLSKSQLDSE